MRKSDKETFKYIVYDSDTGGVIFKANTPAYFDTADELIPILSKLNNGHIYSRYICRLANLADIKKSMKNGPGIYFIQTLYAGLVNTDINVESKVDELLDGQPDKVFISGLAFTLIDVSDNDFQTVLDSVNFNILFQRIQYEVKKLKKEAVYYTKEAARAAEFGSWNGVLSNNYLQKVEESINQIQDLLEWEVNQLWSNTDLNGQHCSQPRKSGIMLSNKILDIRPVF